MFRSEPGDRGAGWRLKWLASTCLAGCMGVCMIGIMVYASTNVDDGRGVMSSIKRASLAAVNPVQRVHVAREARSAAGQKSDRIQVSSLGLATKHIIHDSVVQQRGNRDYIGIRPYVRVVARLSTAQPDDVADIPAFNPFKLFSNPTPVAESGTDPAKSGASDVSVKVTEFKNGLPEEDGIEMRAGQVALLVAETHELLSEAPYAMRPAIVPDGEGLPLIRAAYRPDDLGLHGPSDVARNITVVEKPDVDISDQAIERGEVRSVTVRRGDTLLSILERAGAERWQARAIADAMAPVFSPTALMPGQQMRYTLVPAPGDTDAKEPAKVSIFSDDKHEVTVVRDGAGDYVASDRPVALDSAVGTHPARRLPQRANLYTAFYHAALGQGISHEMIRQLLRVHSHDTDFKRPVRPADSFELFFELPEGQNGTADAEPGELLFTSMMLDGERREYYRFRTPDGVVDFYDAEGNSARTFLLRRPVRGARLSSSFGMRNHPLLRYVRKHLGTDWAAPRGTPVLAAGNGVVETVERKGGYGNYIRIRHANGYKTAYAHMHNFAEGLRPGVKVEQGQIIGYVGSTGVSTGPHLHFEVLVNNRHVDPMTIQVPRGRQLAGRELTEFIKARNSIDELMQRSPVTTRVASISQEAR